MHPWKAETENGKLPRSLSSGSRINLQASNQKPTDGNIPLCTTENLMAGVSVSVFNGVPLGSADIVGNRVLSARMDPGLFKCA